MTSKVNGKKSVAEKYLYGGVCVCNFLNLDKKKRYHSGYEFKRVVCSYCQGKKRRKE